MHCKTLATTFVLVVTRLAWCLEPAPMEITDDVIAVANGGNEFGTDLYARLTSDQPINLCFSPYSISLAVAMTYAGAEGQTEAQIAKVMRFPTSEAQLHTAFGTLRKLLDSGEKTAGFQLRVANRLWGQKGFHFLPEFLQVTKGDYGADLGLLDFKQAEAARNTINSWIEEQTDHKIRYLLAPGVLDANTRLVLTNAIYFKARWSHEFEKANTKDAPFHISAAHQVTVPMMNQTHSFRCLAMDDLRIVALPYDQHEKLSMWVLLPSQLGGLADLQKRLTGDNLRKWSKGLQERAVRVSLPKFKVTAQFQMNDVLERMGMTLAFDPQRADFSGMSTEKQLFLAAVIHKAFVDVNEEGTEAAAATEVIMTPTAMRDLGEPVEFRADHPFVFIIRDNRTESILFLGQVVDPRATN
jgi:serpin B